MAIHIIWAIVTLFVALIGAALFDKTVNGPKVMRADDIAKAFQTVADRIAKLEAADLERSKAVDALKLDNTAGSLAHRIRTYGDGS